MGKALGRRFVSILAVILLACGVSLLPADDLARMDLPRSWEQDAELTDVFFLNGQLGWSVGAQGLIWRTVDGGQSWSKISTAVKTEAEELGLAQKLRNMQPIHEAELLRPVRCRFETIFFVDADNGWVAGGFEYPFLERSRAVLLRTKDGGQSWNSVEGLVLPRISRMWFEDRLVGWAIGDASNLYQTGVFHTTDGGLTWSSHSSGRLKNWIDGEQTRDGFVLLDADGQLFKVTTAGAEKSIILGDLQSRVTALKMLDDQRGLCVGINGLILKTDDGGLSWRRPPQFSQPWLEGIDFQSVTQSGEKFWLVGNPGTIALSIDQQTGEIAKHSLPAASLADIAFADENHAAAVGALGTIVHTHDGGHTWQRVEGTDRVALLNVFPSVADVPFEVLANYSSEEGYVSANVYLNKLNHSRLRALQQATERIGSGYCCELVGDPDAVDRQAADEQTIAKLVREIRKLQPNVVLSQGGFATESLVRAAIRAAADPSAYRDQVQTCGLRAWDVDRLAIADPDGELTIDPRRLLPRMGNLVEDQVAVSRGLLDLNIQSPEKASFRLIELTSRSQARRSDLFEGLDRFGKQLPRRSLTGGRGNLEMIRQMSQKQQRMRQLMAIEFNTPQAALLWRKQLQELVGLLNDDTAGVWMMQLAQQYLESGNAERAAQAIEYLANRWPDHALSPAAMTWLIQYYASSEFSRLAFDEAKDLQLQIDKANQNSTGAQPHAVTVGGVTKTVWIPNDEPDEVEDESLGEVATIDSGEFLRGRRQNASLILTRLRQRDPDLVLGKDYRFIESQLTREQSGWLPAVNLLRQLSKDIIDFPQTALAAKREIQLHEQEQTLPEGTLTSQPAQTRPYLDGKDEDEVWKNAVANGNVVSRTVAAKDGEQADTIMFAHDSEFLFVLVRCHKIKGQGYGAKSVSKTHDADISRQDRIEFQFDLDRDYASSMRFAVDHRGLAADGCAGCNGWNPDWYLARSETPDAWTVEIAIPFSRMSFDPPVDVVWAVSMRRLNRDSDDLWLDALDRPAGVESSRETGLQAGLISDPGLFWLLKFE
jgi:photosystem II stability/assembly factor-like uncharacterized protein